MSRDSVTCARARVLFQVIEPRRAGNRDDVRRLRQHPGERQLAHRAALLARECRSPSSSARFFGEVIAWKRGIPRRMSFGGSVETSRSPPVRKPRASGLKATNVMPSSRQVSRTATSALRVHSEYSVCTAVIGWTRAPCAIVVADTSLRPIVLTLPSVTRSASAPTLSSIGQRLSQRCR